MIDNKSFILGIISAKGLFTFKVQKSIGTVIPLFVISVPFKDMKLLFMIKRDIGVGRLSMDKNGVCLYHVTKKKECKILSKFIGNNLKDTNKHKEFMNWLKGIEYIEETDDYIKCVEFIESLRSTRLNKYEKFGYYKIKFDQLNKEVPATGLLNKE